MNLFAISRQALATGQGSSPFLFVSGSEDTFWQVYYELHRKKRERRDTPLLDRLLTGGRRETEEIMAVIIQIVAVSDKVPAVNGGGISFVE